MQGHFWNLSKNLVLLALADEYTELELKSKILVKLLDTEVPGPFKIGKPLLVVLMSTELSDLVVHRAAPLKVADALKVDVEKWKRGEA
jgi:hypothetical protein